MSTHEHKFSNDEITVVWKPEICIHSTICWKGTHALPEVFKPGTKPWIQMNQAETERIIKQVEKCPSGALSWIRKEE